MIAVLKGKSLRSWQFESTRLEPGFPASRLEQAARRIIHPQADHQAALKESSTALFRPRPFPKIGRSRNEFFPFGIIASGTGPRLGLSLKFFDSSHAPSRGSQISGWSSKNSGPSQHWICKWSSSSSITAVSLGKYRLTFSAPTSKPVIAHPLLCVLTTIHPAVPRPIPEPGRPRIGGRCEKAPRFRLKNSASGS